MRSYKYIVFDAEIKIKPCPCPRSQGGVEVYGVDKVDKLGRAGVGRFLCRCPAKEKPPSLECEEMAES